MLEYLSVQNVVLIDKLDLNLKPGLSVLTGETGAGKSILLDSLGLALGSRAETSLIRKSEEKLSVTAAFSIKNKKHPVYALLSENDLDFDEELVIKRSLSRDGKGKIFLNDQLISAKILKEIGQLLVEVHGQFDNHGLLNQANHLDILDSYAGSQCLRDITAEKYQIYKNAMQELAQALVDIEKSKADEESLKHWVSELEKLKPTEGEEETLARRRLELMNAEKIIESLSFAGSQLMGSVDVVSNIRSAQTALLKANTLTDGKYDEIVSLLEQGMINVSEAAAEIEEASSNIGHNQNELENIEERLFALKAAARKHQVGLNELPQILIDLKNKLNNIEQGEDGLKALHQKVDAAKKAFLENAQDLSQKRTEAAKVLDKNVMNELPALKMEKAKFVTVIEPKDEALWNENGIDNVYFTVSTNPGSPQGPLNKIASGGELARFMLALKLNLAVSSDIVAMIFDEVDTGIGGATAEAVGERLARLAQNVQVLLVTHSPQVAAKSSHHYKIEKQTKGDITTTNVLELDKEQKKEEIARMLAGEIISDEARAAAKVLIG